MTFSELAKQRYSVRKFDTRKIEDEKLQLILEAGQAAPTARDNQPQKIYVVRSEEGLAKMKECSPCCFDAPLVFIFAYDRNTESFNIDTEDHMGSVDADIVQTHMMLQAAELGLGTCWVKMFNPAKLREAFDIPKNIKITNIMPCGYPAADAQPSPRHTDRKPLSETVEYR